MKTSGNPYLAPQEESHGRHGSRFPRRAAIFLSFLSFNLLATFAPGLLWMAAEGDLDYRFVFVPVIAPLLFFWVTDTVLPWCALAAYLMLITLASWFLCRYGVAWLLLPVALFLLTAVQALMVVNLLHGLDAL